MSGQIDPIPCRTVAQAAFARIRWLAPDAGDGMASRQTRALRLMIVEDETFIAFDVQQILENVGYKVVGSALTAEAAVEKAGRLMPDLILMDIRLLSRRDGVDAAIEIREKFGIRSIFVTAYADAATIGRARAAEPLGFVAKPFTRAALVEAVSRYAQLL